MTERAKFDDDKSGGELPAGDNQQLGVRVVALLVPRPESLQVPGITSGWLASEVRQLEAAA